MMTVAYASRVLTLGLTLLFFLSLLAYVQANCINNIPIPTPTNREIVCYIYLQIMILVSYRFRMFLKRHGRTHALTGLVYLCLLVLSFLEVFLKLDVHDLLLDISLGICGTFLAYSASIDFQHKNIKNVASGTLDKHATVTNGEMLEHAFYQLVNLFQIVYLHFISTDVVFWKRIFLLLSATSIWLMRGLFPVNSFSANYEKIDPKSSDFIRLLYRLKKYQYVFYKHFLLHGLNISAALYGISMAHDENFRMYWLLLNTSFVMEFFLQTLVKKEYLKQSQLLIFQRILMVASSVAAMHALKYVNVFVALFSLFLNFVHRYHEVSNFVFVVVIVAGMHALNVI